MTGRKDLLVNLKAFISVVMIVKNEGGNAELSEANPLTDVPLTANWTSFNVSSRL
jgi:hypothetical protein